MRYSVLQFVLPTNTRVAVCCSLKKYTCCSVPIHVLQCANTRVAVCRYTCCSVPIHVLQCAAVCSTGQLTASPCSTSIVYQSFKIDTLQQAARRCNTLQHTAAHCTILQHNTSNLERARLIGYRAFSTESRAHLIRYWAPSRRYTSDMTASHSSTSIWY